MARRLSLFACTVVIAAALCSAAQARESALEKMERAVKELVTEVTPSVVAVELVHANFKGPAPKPGSLEHLIRQKLVQNAGGSGFAISPDMVVTCSRAVPPGIETLRVVLVSGEYREAKVLGRSDDDNVIILEVSGGGLKPIQIKPSLPNKGDFVMSVGNSFAVTSRMWRLAYSIGIVSGLYEVSNGFNAYYSGQVIETDAAVNPGNFGGPLIDGSGAVVGMITSSFSHRRWLGCAVPASRVLQAVARITGEEGPEPASGDEFGVESMGVTLSETGGAWVVSAVKKGGIASKVGFRPGDRIVRVNGSAPSGGTASAARAFGRGSKVRVEVDRDGFRVGYDFEVPGQDKPRDESEF